MTSLGPMVYRSAHLGAALMIAGVLQFLVGMAIAQYLYPYSAYSLTGNLISDLGSPGSSAHGMVFNLSIGILGLFTVLAAFLVRSAFTGRSTARIGILSLALAGVFALLVGRFPESSSELGGNIHPLLSALTFFFAGLALVFLGIAMVRDTRWRGMRLFTFLSGIVTWIALALFIWGTVGPLGVGGMERLVVAPILLWGIAAGVHLLRIPRFRANAVQSWSPSAGA